MIDKLEYGQAPVPLLPATLINFWEDKILPGWLISHARLPLNATFRYLGPEFWNSNDNISEQIEHFVMFFVQTNIRECQQIKWTSEYWPVGASLQQLHLSTRVKNCLRATGLIDSPERICNMTFGELFAIPRMGVKSVIQLTSSLEALFAKNHREINSFVAGEQTTNKDSPMELLQELRQHSWIDQISNGDKRFAAIFPLREILGVEVETMLAEPDSISVVSSVPTLLNCIGPIKQEVARIDGLNLDDALADLLRRSNRLDEKKLEALSARLGWGGSPPITLDEAGKMIGVTRERLRQIQSRFERGLPSHPIYMPALDRAIQFLEDEAPIEVDMAAVQIRNSGLSAKPFHPESIIEIAKVLHRNSVLQIAEKKGVRVVVVNSQEQWLGKVSARARQLAGQSGVGSVFQVARTFENLKAPITEEAARKLLRQLKNVEFLNDDWFWVTTIPDGRNRLCNITQKMLAVASPQSLAGIREGLQRAYRWRNSTRGESFAELIVPPMDILALFYNCHPNFRLENGKLRSTRTLDIKHELGDVEKALVETFRATATGVLDRESAIGGCVMRGLNEATASIYLTFSALIEHLGVNLWKLRGVQVDPAAVEAVRLANAARPREQMVLDHGWSNSGLLWIAAKLPKHFSSLVVGVPSGAKRFLVAQSFSAKSKVMGYECGKIVFNEDGSAYGFGKFLRESGADEGDILMAEYDLGRQEVLLSVGPSEILDQLH